MKKSPLLLFVVYLLLANPALGGQAIPTSGDFLKYCQESIKFLDDKPADKSASGSCIGFVEAAIGMHEVFDATNKGTPFYCIPETGMSVFDAISVWTKYLVSNPQKLNNAPIITFILAISEEFPCSESKTK